MIESKYFFLNKGKVIEENMCPCKMCTTTNKLRKEGKI